MKHFFSLFSFSLMLVLFGCQSKDAENKAESIVEGQQIDADAPQPSSSNLLRCDTMTVAGHEYIITIDRKTDESLPRVKDENDVVFFDNTVAVSITDKGRTIYENTFSKADFESYVSDADRAVSVFQGMAFDRDNSAASAICLGAQLGQPGLEGEGPAFNVFIPTSGGKARIEKVANPFTPLDDMTGEGD